MPSPTLTRQPHRRLPCDYSLVRTVSACAIWSRFASPRAELIGSPSLSRPNLFSGD
jgi:hypothetical protein